MFNAQPTATVISRRWERGKNVALVVVMLVEGGGGGGGGGGDQGGLHSEREGKEEEGCWGCGLR